MPTIKIKMKPYIQPFEKRLASLELSSLVGNFEIDQLDDGPVALVNTRISLEKIAGKLTYWEYIEADERFYTRQSLRESTVNVVRNGVSFKEITMPLLFDESIFLPNRRCLRYASHGIHEYKGKFFPQLVRSLLNIAEIKGENKKILDPMCGSGTTLVESVLENHQAIGIDMNPLSVFITKTKCDVLKLKPAKLEREYVQIRDELLYVKPLRYLDSLIYFKSLPLNDQEYLANWFAIEVLTDLDQISCAISNIKDETIRNFFWVSLSNILRKVSWQKLDDLRVRKEILNDVEVDAIKEFFKDLERSIRLVLAFIRQNSQLDVGNSSVYHGDSKQLINSIKSGHGLVDIIITSPPYATALPYLDTDRLSLSYLGLLPREKHRTADSLMIGNREISETRRKELWNEYWMRRSELPGSVEKLINKIHRLNDNSPVGFRRKNLSALLGKYFFDMKEMFSNMHSAMKKNAVVFVVIGDNHTVAGGVHVDIGTIKFMSLIAVAEGFDLVERIDMEMLANRTIHKNNATKSESILWLRKR